ncbi:Proton-coupled amino acid transporter-like protein [Lucilia cuprina]|nr:Proton-coupled amino acid transporter-like protein [Lucilia cuprina]
MKTAALDESPKIAKANATSNITDDYDPHDHRNVKNPTNNWQTMAHFLKASIGTGVLAMPSAFANAGYINGFILTAIIGAIAVYCLHILIGSMYVLCKRKRVPYLTFSEAMTMGFQEGPPCFKCIVPIATIRDLRFLAIFSSIANVLLFVGFAVILYYIFDYLPPLSEREPVEKLAKLPIFFGTVLFALEAVGVVSK